MKLGKAVATSATAVVGVIAGVGSIAFPPALLVLPVVLPIMVLLGDYLEVKNNKRIKGKLRVSSNEWRNSLLQSVKLRSERSERQSPSWRQLLVVSAS